MVTFPKQQRNCMITTVRDKSTTLRYVTWHVPAQPSPAQPSPGCAGRQVTNGGGGGGSGAAAPPLQDSGHRARSGDNTTVSGSVLYWYPLHILICLSVRASQDSNSRPYKWHFGSKRSCINGNTRFLSKWTPTLSIVHWILIIRCSVKISKYL